jgi:putative PIN family toxin of toxin-antitoxin system
MASRDITAIERVVFDTNIWISGLLWRGKPYQCLLLARSGIVQLVHCSSMMAELAQKLRQPFGFTENRLQAVLYDYKRISHQVDITGNLHIVGDDPNDDKFVEWALVAGASLIVSGDRHLLDLGEYQDVRVLPAAEFVAQFTRQD